MRQGPAMSKRTGWRCVFENQISFGILLVFEGRRVWNEAEAGVFIDAGALRAQSPRSFMDQSV